MSTERGLYLDCGEMLGSLDVSSSPFSRGEIVRSLPASDLRLIVRPGLVRRARAWPEYDPEPAIKISYELTYTCLWSLGLDLRIQFRAVSTAWSTRGV